jgi:hypothetical protein
MAYSSFSWPPCRRRVAGRNFVRSQRYELAALVGIATDLRTIPATHVSFQFVNRRCFGPPHDIQRHRLMRVAAKAFDFEIKITGVERVAERRRRLGRSPKAEHALVPSIAGEPVSLLARLSRPLR